MFHAQPATNIAAVARTMPRDRGVDRYQARTRGHVTSGPAASPRGSPTGSRPGHRRHVASSCRLPVSGAVPSAGLYWDQRRRATAVPRNRLSGQAHHGLRASGREAVDRRVRGARPAHGGLRRPAGRRCGRGPARPRAGGRPSAPSTPGPAPSVRRHRIRGGSDGSAAGTNGSVPSLGPQGGAGVLRGVRHHPRPGGGDVVGEELPDAGHHLLLLERPVGIQRRWRPGPGPHRRRWRGSGRAGTPPDRR